MKTIMILFLALAAAVAVKAQDIYTPVLESIAANSPELKMQESEYRVTVAENATGLSPENPEVEFGYLWGGRETGNRKDVSVTQQFDFPTVYGRRSKLSRSKDASAASLLKTQRLEVMVEAKELLVELLYQNALLKQAEEQLEYAGRIEQTYSRLMELGQATAIEYNKAKLNLTDRRNELAVIEVERKRLADRLKMLNGGNEVVFEATDFPQQPLPADFETWYAEAEKQSPALQYLHSQIQVSEGNVAVVKSEGLPKLSVGYMGEFVRGSNFQGVTVGVSIPLWQNRNRVRHAESQAVVARETLDRARSEYYLSLRSLFAEAWTLGDVEQSYAAGLADADNQELLHKALDRGVMTLLQYLDESQYTLDLKHKLLTARRDRALALTRLYAHTL